MVTVEEIQDFLMERMQLRHNVVTGRTEYRLPSTYGREGTEWTPVTDRVVNSLWTELSATKTVRAPDIYRVIESDFVPEFNPFAFYLEHLPPWNGEDHILSMSVTVSVRGGAEQQMLFYQYFRKWLVAMVASWVDDEVVNHLVLVLIGRQGSYKTTWFSMLLPP